MYPSLSLHVSVCASVCPSVSVPVSLSVCLPACLSVCLSAISLSVHLYVSLSVCLWVSLPLSVCPSVCACVSICVCRRRVCLLLTPLLVYLAVLVLPSSPLDLVSSSSFYSTHVVCTRDVTELLKSTSIRFGFCVLCFKSVGFECRFAKWSQLVLSIYNYTHTHTRLTAFCSGLPG